MTEPQTTEPQSPQPAAKPGPDIMANLRSVPLVEKILAIIAILVVIGWLAKGSSFWNSIFREWFTTLSFLGAVAVAALVILKVFGIRLLTPKPERYALAGLSLLPVAGFIITVALSSVDGFLTIGGSLALAYVSATTYWRKQITDLATKSFGDAEAGGGAPSGGPPASGTK